LRQGIQFVESQLTTLRQRVDKLQAQLQRFRQQHNLLDPDLQASQLTTQVNAIAQQRLETEKQLAETQALYATLQGRVGASTAMKEAPVYQKLLDQLREINTKIAQESSRFSERNPAVQALRDQQQALLPLIRQEAERVLGSKLAEVATQAAVLEVRSQTIAQTEANLKQQVNQLPALTRQYADLRRELDVANQSLNRFLANRESLQVNAAQKEIPWQRMSIPEKPQIPISPNKARNFLLGAIAGLLLGIAAAMLAERVDDKFHSIDDLKNRTKLPLLGTIPHQPTLASSGIAVQASPEPDFLDPNFLEPSFLDPALPNSGSRSPLLTQLMQRLRPTPPDRPYAAVSFLEAFRSLYTNICLLGSDSPIRAIVTSSALPGDGKSTVAISLAQSAAAMGQRVLLVDADLRRPQIGQRLGLPNFKGLSNLIASEIEFEQVVQRSDSASLASWASGGLWVLTSGPIPPDSTKLLSSKKMQHLMAQFRSQFDLVIYDTPPVLGFADSTLLVSHTDGLVMVVRLNQTDRGAIAQALEGLSLSNSPILGIVANGSQDDRATSFDYHHYYSSARQA
jgi:polysaccharide biosynthesis transport protein